MIKENTNNIKKGGVQKKKFGVDVFVNKLTKI